MGYMKGVILAGGNGTRLKLSTRVTNKHLLPVYDKPMILYPLETLKELGITDILIVSGGNHVGGFTELLGDGAEFGVKLTYRVQKEAGGIAQALALAEGFVEDQFAVILGDNIFEFAPQPMTAGCGIVLKKTLDPQRFGVYHDGVIEEKPMVPKSLMAVTGLYFYVPVIFDHIRTLTPSQRGELEITDLNNWCLRTLRPEIIECQGFWSDAGTPESLLRASDFMYRYGKK
jgi:glucose-1-phosphate thymidylyltransferase